MNDLLGCMQDPPAFFDEFHGPKYKLKLKKLLRRLTTFVVKFPVTVTAPFSWGAKTYVQRLITNYELMFKRNPRNRLRLPNMAIILTLTQVRPLTQTVLAGIKTLLGDLL
jgi:hypothetical protein